MTLDDSAERVGSVRLLPSLGAPSANVADGRHAHWETPRKPQSLTMGMTG
ncbi:hypothetical protein C8J34_10776 [Rhizobium sp. PP-F2F-G36]|nr:hypothetical protein C8J31_1119 [Rhizobium sp. PP-CC-2G-626]TCQ05345.1 hypothetical protein C8J34_10776 [Rhizobium sp. PP-F2F-G36]